MQLTDHIPPKTSSADFFLLTQSKKVELLCK